MNVWHRILTIVIALVVLQLNSCAPAAPQATAQPVLPSPTPLPPSDTPLPPTPTHVPPTETLLPTETPVTPTRPPDTRTPVPTVEGVSGMVEVNGLNLHYECYGEGEPTVVIEPGLGMGVDDWHRIMYMIAPTTRICSYDRPGYGQSDRPAAKYTSLDMVNALHQLMGSAGIPGPYILVGHSAGGLNALIFGSEWLAETAGIVLVDPSIPDQYKLLLDRLPAGQAGEVKRCRREAEYLDKSWNEPNLISLGAWWNLYESAKQLRSITSLDDLPMVVITAGIMDASCSGEYGELERQIGRELHAKYAGLSTNGVQIIAENSGHFIHAGDPQLVADTILQMVEQVRGNE